MSGKDGRDEGIKKVAKNNSEWLTAGLTAIMEMKRGRWRGTGEELRLLLAPKIGEPTHPNAWGALVMHARRHEPPLLHPTGIFRQMQLKRSHARITREYVR